MTRPPRGNKPAPPTTAPVALADRVLFYVLLAVLAARAMIGESYERIEFSFINDIAAGAGVTPATTAWLDCIVLAAASLTLARRRHWRSRPGVVLGLLLLATGYVVSTLAATDTYMARFVGASLLVGVLGGIALASLVRRPWMLQLVVATLLATGVTTAYKCVRQVTDEFPETKRMWESEFKPQILVQGHDLTDPSIINFERRMASGEAYGFLAHPNVTGSGLMMALLAATGLLVGMLRRGPSSTPAVPDWITVVGAVGGAGLLATGMWLTGSLGAIGSAALGIVALLLLGCCARWASIHARGLLTAFVVSYVGVVALVTTYGVRAGTLPHPSLEFRWHYWTAAAQAYEDHPLTGIGRYNFPAAYLRHKAPESTEEVKDPHNLWVSLWVELGPLGLVGGVLLCGVTALESLRRLNLNAPGPAREPNPRIVVVHAAPLLVGVLLLHALFSGTGEGQPALWLLWAVDLGGVWAVGLGLALWLLTRIEQNERGMAWVSAGLCAAVLAAFVHALLDFTLMTPGGLALFVLCAVAATSRARAPRSTPQRSRPWTRRLSIVAAVALAGVYVWQIAIPVQQTQRRLHSLDVAARAGFLQPGLDSVCQTATTILAKCEDELAQRTAVRTVLQNTHASRLSIERQIQVLSSLRRLFSESLAAPIHAGTWATRAQLESELARLYARQGNSREASASWKSAAESWDRAVALYPTDPRMQISAGQTWLEVWRASATSDAAQRAREHFEAALRIDDTRPAIEVQRLPPTERTTIEDALNELP